MDPDLLDDEGLSLVRKSLLPHPRFFLPDDLEEERRREEFASALDGEHVVVIADRDADGLGCAAAIREHHGAAALVPTSPHDLAGAIERTARLLEPDAEVYVCDLCPDDVASIAEPLAALAERAGPIHWFDHHQWDEAVERAVREADVELVVGDSDEECTLDVTLRSLPAEPPARLAELAAVTRDHDLWIREDERSDDVADFAYWSDAEEYVETVRAHGVDLPAEVQAMLADRRIEKEALIELATDRAVLREVGPWTVGVTYGRCSQNEVAEALRRRGADAAVIVKPSGSASIRGSDGFERCHEVARLVEGGGHPRAAGCKPPIYDDMLDYAHHWTTEGAVTKRVILEGFRRIAAETAGSA